MEDGKRIRWDLYLVPGFLDFSVSASVRFCSVGWGVPFSGMPKDSKNWVFILKQGRFLSLGFAFRQNDKCLNQYPNLLF